MQQNIWLTFISSSLWNFEFFSKYVTCTRRECPNFKTVTQFFSLTFSLTLEHVAVVSKVFQAFSDGDTQHLGCNVELKSQWAIKASCRGHQLPCHLKTFVSLARIFYNLPSSFVHFGKHTWFLPSHLMIMFGNSQLWVEPFQT